MEHLFGLMVVDMMVSLNIIILMDLVITNGQMEENIKDNGNKTR
jgi:hypothetical protein